MQIDGSHYDYTNQAWTVDGIYQDCSHPAAMNCGCYGRKHAGELADVANLPTATEIEADDKPSAEKLLEVAQAAQIAYWDAVSALEGELDIELDGCGELAGYTVESLIEQFDK